MEIRAIIVVSKSLIADTAAERVTIIAITAEEPILSETLIER